MIKGQTIHLRVIENTDLETVRSWYNNPSLRGTDDISMPVTVPQMEKKIKEWQNQENRFHLLLEKQNGFQILGKITINTFHSSITLIIPQQDADHEKAITESLHLALRYLFFESANKAQASIWIPSWNEWLIEIVKKFGMKPAGRLRRTGMREGCYYDHVIFDLLRSEYLELFSG
ncbi:MAG: GNAT family N-acetyltransferase [Promethearchaeota archaeon]